MNSNMDLKQHQVARQRAIALGRSQDPASLPELAQLLKMPSADVRRLAASAIGKLSGFGADGAMAADALAPIALHDPHPQTQQYALKALKIYGAFAEAWLDELDDLAMRPHRKEYIPVAASAAARTIREAVQHREQQKERCCLKCGRHVAFDEFERSMRLFQRIYCDKCFDETCVKRRNWETDVEEKKPNSPRLLSPSIRCLYRILGDGHPALQSGDVSQAGPLSENGQKIGFALSGRQTEP